MPQPQLTRYVHVDGQVFGPGDEPPRDVAARITNPKVWEGGVLPPSARADVGEPDVGGFVPAGTTQVQNDSGEPVPVYPAQPPPTSGKGSGRDAWVAYATGQGVTVPDDASRDDIVAALAAAEFPTARD